MVFVETVAEISDPSGDDIMEWGFVVFCGEGDQGESPEPVGVAVVGVFSEEGNGSSAVCGSTNGEKVRADFAILWDGDFTVLKKGSEGVGHFEF